MLRRCSLLIGAFTIGVVPLCLYAYCTRFLWKGLRPLDGYVAFLLGGLIFAFGNVLIFVGTQRRTLRLATSACAVLGLFCGATSDAGHGLGALLGLLLCFALPLAAFFIMLCAAAEAWCASDPRDGCCRCRYNLSGNTSGVCPECGAAITESSLK